MDIGVYKRILNSDELRCYEFLVGVREVNSWEELGELLMDVFNMDLDVSSGESYMNSVEYVDFLIVLNVLIIKYLSYDPTVVYSFKLKYDKSYMVYFGDMGYDFCIEFKSNHTDLIHHQNNNSFTDIISGCVFTEIDRYLGLADFAIKIYNTDQNLMVFKNVDLSDITLYKFKYNGNIITNGIFLSYYVKTWGEYLGLYVRNHSKASKGLVMISDIDEVF